jgi:hypothetical protein
MEQTDAFEISSVEQAIKLYVADQVARRLSKSSLRQSRGFLEVNAFDSYSSARRRKGIDTQSTTHHNFGAVLVTRISELFGCAEHGNSSQRPRKAEDRSFRRVLTSIRDRGSGHACASTDESRRCGRHSH